ncbi:hypothetical protein ABCS02_09505 [Microbacterium sp. X-17]|uniref:hypothetical protein n=1 Tax=Microbacterium sp. X-17 TaxID=3144404 RepID=UPI0031F5D7EA
MHGDRFFEDLEHQLDAEWEAERAALDSEAERVRISRLTLRDRLSALVGELPIGLDLVSGEPAQGRLWAVGADWAGMEGPRGSHLLVPLAAIRGIRLPLPDLLLSTRADAAAARRSVAERMGLGFVLRAVARRRLPVLVRLDRDREVTGTIDRAGADHLDLALHPGDAPRRAEEVSGFAIVPFAAIVAIRVDERPV